jgi:hypothetical protein
MQVCKHINITKMAIALVKDQLEAESIRRESKVEGITR